MRCHFDLVDGSQTIRDDEGVNVESIDQAIADAAEVVREMLASGELQGSPGLWRLDIRGEDGAVLASVPIA